MQYRLYNRDCRSDLIGRHRSCTRCRIAPGGAPRSICARRWAGRRIRTLIRESFRGRLFDHSPEPGARRQCGRRSITVVGGRPPWSVADRRGRRLTAPGGTWKGRSIVHDPRRDQSKITAIPGPRPAIMITRGHDMLDSCADLPSAPRRIGILPPAFRCDCKHIGPRSAGPVDPGHADLPHPAATWWK